MLTNRRCAAMLPAADLERAKKWYADTLGLSPEFEDSDGMQYKAADGTEFWVYLSQFAGTNKATAMAWVAPKLEDDMEELRSRGVTFEEYDIPGVKTVNGVAEFSDGERGAWFKDSEGNILGVFESPKYA